MVKKVLDAETLDPVAPSPEGRAQLEERYWRLAPPDSDGPPECLIKLNDAVLNFEALARTGGAISQYPVWAKGEWAAPNTWLRGSLFAPKCRTSKAYLAKEPIAFIGNARILYSGPQLDQGHLDIILQLMHLGAEQHPGICNPQEATPENHPGVIRLFGNTRPHETIIRMVPIRFHDRHILKSLGLSSGGKNNYATLRARLDMLTKASFDLYEEGSRPFSNPNIIYRHSIDPETHERVVLIPRDQFLMLLSGYTRLDRSVRTQLSSGAAKWLHGYIDSHRSSKANPGRLSLGQLRALGVSHAKCNRKFRQTINRAMRELSAAQQISSFWWEHKASVLMWY